MNAHGWVIALLVLLAPLEADAGAKDPRVPPGSDPGGVAVAIVSSGIDYTLPHIATRLARDGEGEIIGWDFVDGDALPFEASQERRPAGRLVNGAAWAEVMLAAAPGARVVPVRIDPQQPGSIIRSLAFAGQTPARIVLIASSDSEELDQEPFRQAAQHFKQLLIVIPADTTQKRIADAGADLDNILIVTSSAADTGDLSEQRDCASQLPPAGAAAARAAGIAAEAAAAAPGLDGAGLRQAVLAKLANQAR